MRSNLYKAVRDHMYGVLILTEKFGDEMHEFSQNDTTPLSVEELNDLIEFCQTYKTMGNSLFQLGKELEKSAKALRKVTRPAT